MTDDDIYSRMIEFKVKNQIIKVSRNYNNADKIKWTDKYVHEHNTHDKKNAGNVYEGSFPQ